MTLENLQTLKKDFIKALKENTEQATNDTDFEELEDVVVDILNCIPRVLCKCDFYTRSDIQNRMPEELQNDPQKVSALMEYIYNQDAIYFGDYVVENVDECIDEFTAQQGI